MVWHLLRKLINQWFAYTLFSYTIIDLLTSLQLFGRAQNTVEIAGPLKAISGISLLQNLPPRALEGAENERSKGYRRKIRQKGKTGNALKDMQTWKQTRALLEATTPTACMLPAPNKLRSTECKACKWPRCDAVQWGSNISNKISVCSNTKHQVPACGPSLLLKASFSINALRRSKYAACSSTSLCPAPATHKGSTEEGHCS